MSRQHRARLNALVGPDVTPPSAPVLTATPGVGEMLLEWTAATDDVGVAEYEVWRDSTYLSTETAGTFSYVATGLTPGVSHTWKVVAYDAARNYTNSNLPSAAADAPSGSVFVERLVGGAFDASWSADVISGTGTIDVVSDQTYEGSYSAKIDKPLADATCYKRRTFSATDSVRVSAPYRWDTDSGDDNNNGTGPRVFSGTDRIFDVFRQDDTDKRIALRYQSTGLTSGDALYIQTGQTVELDTWVMLDMQCDYAAGPNSRIRVWVNGVLRIDARNLVVYAGGFTAFQIGSEHTTQFLDMWVGAPITIDTDPDDSAITGTTYYVSNTGSNAASGTSEATPWQTIGKVNSSMATFVPGDAVLFKRGGTYSDAGLNFTKSGTSSDPILIGAYGTGVDPIFDGGGNYANGNPLNPIPGPWPIKGSRDPISLRGNWLVMEEFITQQGNFSGVKVYGDDCEIRNFMSRWNVAGIMTDSGCARLNAHDYVLLDNAVMSVNAPGGDDDSGAFGHAIFGADGEFHHFTSSGHRATSHDYGIDGSTIEIYGGKRNVFHHCTAVDDEAFTELGNQATEDTTYHHCVYYSLAGDGRIGFNVQGSPWGSPLRTKIYHCTVFLPAGTANSGLSIGTVTSWAAGTAYSVGTRRAPALTNAKANGHIYEVTVAGTSSGTEPTWPTNGGTVVDGGVTWIDRGLQAEVKNNIVVASWKSGFFGAPADENDNIYYGYSQNQVRSINNATPASFGVGTASLLATNPLFVSTVTPDLHLQAGSPAVNAGQDLGYTTDRDDLPRAVGTPDIGAYERQ